MMKPIQRSLDYVSRYGMSNPIFLAPMAGACPAKLSAEVANAGGAGSCGALLMSPSQIEVWAADFRAASDGAFQFNLWVPDADPVRDPDHEVKVREYLSTWGSDVPADAGDAKPLDFAEQCAAIIATKPPIFSSVMGLFPPNIAADLKASRIDWLASVTSVDEARQAEAAGADAILVQGMEAGGHRAYFDPIDANDRLIGLVSLLPAVVDAVKLPVIAAGGISDGRGVAAALCLGASAVAIGTGFLRTPEAGIPSAWADGIGASAPEDTIISKTFSGRSGRSLATDYARAATSVDAPNPAPYPVQRGLTQTMRTEGAKQNELARIQAWAGQSSGLAKAEPAGALLKSIWQDATSLLD